MQNRIVFPTIVVSVIAVIAFGVQLIREHNRVYHITLATGGKTGEYYAFGQAFAQLVQRHDPKIQIEVLETKGSKQNMQDLNDNTVQLALVQSDTPVLPNVQGVALLFPEVFHFIARQDSGMKGIGDLKGKRIALMPEGSGSYDLFWPLSNHYGLQATDFDYRPMSPTAAQAALLNGEVDALFRVIAMGNSAVGDLLTSGEAILLPIDQVEALQLSLPYLERTYIPKGTYDGGSPIPSQDLPVVAVSAILVTNQQVDPHIIQTLTRILHEFRNELVVDYPRAAMIRLPDAGRNLGMPLHAGAKAYYNQDQPNFLVEYSEPIGLLISVSLLLVSGLWQFRLWLIGRQKNRADMYNLEILELIDQVHHAQTLAELIDIRQKLFDILRQVVVDLDIDRISAESFQSFTFPWEVAITTIRHREMILLAAKSKPSALDERLDLL